MPAEVAAVGFLLCEQLPMSCVLRVPLSLPPSARQLRPGRGGSAGTFLLLFIPCSCPSVSLLPQSDGF